MPTTNVMGAQPCLACIGDPFFITDYLHSGRTTLKDVEFERRWNSHLKQSRILLKKIQT